MRGGEPGQGLHDDLIVGERLGKVAIQEFRVVRLDPTLAEGDPLGDQNACTCFVVVIGEMRDRDGDRKTGQPRHRRESDLGLYLVLSVIPERVGEIAGKLHEQIGVQIRFRVLVFDREEELTTRTPPGTGLEARDPGNAIA